jgi:serine/threonine protein kinase
MSSPSPTTPRVVIASSTEKRRASLRQLLQANHLTVVAALDPADSRLVEFGKDFADVLLVDLSDEEGGPELDFALLDDLLEQCRLPLLFQDAATPAVTPGWDKKLVKKIHNLTNQPCEPCQSPSGVRPVEDELHSFSLEESASTGLEPPSRGEPEIVSSAQLMGPLPSERDQSSQWPTGASGGAQGEPSVQPLPAGTVLDDFRIEKTLSRGGFSIVYRATGLSHGNPVVVKEYMPRRLARRDRKLQVVPKSQRYVARFNRGRKLFSQEARALATLKHPNIVDVLSFVQAYGTAYMIMRFEQGENLGKYIRAHHGSLTERFMLAVFPQILDGLRMVHDNGFLHLDIKPGNIHLRPGGRPLLLDFGAIHEFATTRSHQKGHVVTPGFSPVEQYAVTGYVGPWSDIYALGATMRTCIEGLSPPPGPERRERDRMRPALFAFKNRYSRALLEAIDWAMEIEPLLRPQSVDEFLDALPRTESTEIDLNVEGAQRIGWLGTNLPWHRE